MKLNIILDMGLPEKSDKPTAPKSTVEDDVKEAIDCIESGHDSLVEWKTINRLYKELRALPAKQKTPRIRNLINMIEPTLAKYGLHGVSEDEE